MRLLIYSDVHGNLPAFEAILNDAGTCDGYICLGDLVNYGPWSNECVDLAISLPNSVILLGNHEEAYLEGSYNGQNSLVNEFFRHTINSFNRYHILKSFIFSYQINEYLCVHTIQNKNIYPDTIIDLNNNYIIGHSHHQFIIHSNGYTLINAGSVGQNRKFINISNYIIFDTENNGIQLKSSIFDIDYVIDAMKAEKYPENCILYYLQKNRCKP